MNLTDKAGVVVVKNLAGRVTVLASEEQQSISITATSPLGAPVAEADVRAAVSSSGGTAEIEARPSGEQDRIDFTLRVPARSRLRITTDAGAVDVVGDVREATVETNTGTIRADVPLEALSFNFLWTGSRPRYFSHVELPKERERAGGRYEISGRLGDKKGGQKASKEEQVRLRFATERGVVLLGIEASMVPTDLRERPLTTAARAIIESGNEDMIEAIRTAAPRQVSEYSQIEERLPRHRGEQPPPQLLPARNVESARMRSAVAAAANVSGAVNSSSLAKVNVSVTDVNGRAIDKLTAKDFTVFENGEQRPITDVAAATAPFNLVLLLDASGSVEERLEFIRKAALSFVNTVGAQQADRIAIISFRDDVQLISDFTADRQLLAERITQINAGGATAVYDALAYALTRTIEPLRGERTAIVILSDGDDNKSFLPFPTVVEAVVESGALIYPLYIPSGLMRANSKPAAAQTTLDPVRAKYLSLTSRAEEEGQRLARLSGGVYYSITHLDDLQKAYGDVAAQLRTSYTLTYQSYQSKAAEEEDEGAPGEGEQSSVANRRAPLRVRVNRDGAVVRLSTLAEPADIAQPK